jgi:hypothetical protein
MFQQVVIELFKGGLLVPDPLVRLDIHDSKAPAQKWSLARLNTSGSNEEAVVKVSFKVC